MYIEHPLSEVGLALRYLREQRNLVQQDVADKLGINKASVSRLEQPRGNPTTNSVGHYLRVIGATVHDLANALVILKSGEDPEAQQPELLAEQARKPQSQTQQGPEESDPAEIEAQAIPSLEELRSEPDTAETAQDFDPSLIHFYRRQFVHLNERLAILQAKLGQKDDG